MFIMIKQQAKHQLVIDKPEGMVPSSKGVNLHPDS